MKAEAKNDSNARVAFDLMHAILVHEKNLNRENARQEILRLYAHCRAVVDGADADTGKRKLAVA